VADDATQTAEQTADGPPKAVALVIENSIRSGQTIEFPDGDVTVIGSVSSGAEIIAGGSIHVYGTLRGRAIAGTSGDQTARIFCQDLDAELLSIDGCYRVADNFDPKLRGRPIQARLDGLRMALVPLDYPANATAESLAEEWGSTDKLRRATDRVRQLISIGVPRTPRMAEVAAS
jgi:septum site-determining protein MinC